MNEVILVMNTDYCQEWSISKERGVGARSHRASSEWAQAGSSKVAYMPAASPSMTKKHVLLCQRDDHCSGPLCQRILIEYQISSVHHHGSSAHHAILIMLCCRSSLLWSFCTDISPAVSMHASIRLFSTYSTVWYCMLWSILYRTCTCFYPIMLVCCT